MSKQSLLNKMGLVMKMTGARWFILVVGVVGIGLSFLVMQYAQKQDGLVPSASINDPGRGVRDPVQGEALTPLQSQQVREQDSALAEQALSGGRSFISTPVLQDEPDPPALTIEAPKPAPKPASAPPVGRDMGSFDRPKPNQGERGEAVSGQALADSIARIGEVLNARAETAATTYVFAAPPVPRPQGGVAPTASTTPAPVPESPAAGVTIKPGSLIYGVFNIRMQSDLPGPVLGELVQGEFRGYKVLGRFERIENKNLMTLRLTTLVSPDGHVSKIDGYALHPDTTLPAMASEVDRHAMARIGGFLGASFLAGAQGMGEALERSGETSVDSGDGTVTTVVDEYSTNDLYRIAAGRAAGAMDPVLDHLTRTMMQPNTITVAAGTPFVLLVVGQ